MAEFAAERVIRGTLLSWFDGEASFTVKGGRLCIDLPVDALTEAIIEDLLGDEDAVPALAAEFALDGGAP